MFKKGDIVKDTKYKQNLYEIAEIVEKSPKIVRLMKLTDGTTILAMFTTLEQEFVRVLDGNDIMKGML